MVDDFRRSMSVLSNKSDNLLFLLCLLVMNPLQGGLFELVDIFAHHTSFSLHHYNTLANSVCVRIFLFTSTTCILYVVLIACLSY